MGGPTNLGTCCSSSFVMDHQAGYTLCTPAAEVLVFCFLFFITCSLLTKRSCDPARFNLVPQASAAGSYMANPPVGSTLSSALWEASLLLSESVCSDTFGLLTQNGMSADKEQPGFLCCYNPDLFDPEF